MNKPHGMSRQDARNLKAIVRQFLGSEVALVELSEGMASGSTHQNHEEGYSARYVEVSIPDREYSLKGGKPGSFLVMVEDRSRDCDGRHSSEARYTVGRNSNPRRFYWSRNWETNRPTGNFSKQGDWKIREKGSNFQRDYTAEAAGY